MFHSFMHAFIHSTVTTKTDTESFFFSHESPKLLNYSPAAAP